MKGFYRHKESRSACVEVVKSFYIKEGNRLSIKLSWWKWSPTRGVEWPLGQTHRIKLGRRDWFDNWERIGD